MTHQRRLLLSLLTLGLLQACSSPPPPAPVVEAPPPLIVQPVSYVGATMVLVERAHVCNDEAETKRLAASSQLRSMARYLAEILPTYNCTITELPSEVQILEEAPGYLKVNLEQAEIFTFDDYLLPATAPQPSEVLPVVSCC